MKIRYINRSDICWSAEVILNSKEWPTPLDEQGDWLDRPIIQWAYNNFKWSDHFFTVRGIIYFKNRADAEFFRMVWEQEV